MAVAFLEACDAYQLALFTAVVFFGLRASELCVLFGESLDECWLRAPCLPELNYETKGRQDKQFPLVGNIGALLCAGTAGGRHGLLFLRRSVVDGRESPPLLGATLPALVTEDRRRYGLARSPDASAKRRIRDHVSRNAGGLRYDHIESEFSGLARRLAWPAAATVKDFRHLLCTSLESAGMPEHFRRYLMGHEPEQAAISGYMHLNKLRENLVEVALRREWPGILAVVERRAGELAMPSSIG